MSEKNLPIKLVLQKTSDTQKNQGGGGIKYFCEVTKELQDVMTEKFEGVLSYYESVFQESELIPAVGKITVRPAVVLTALQFPMTGFFPFLSYNEIRYALKRLVKGRVLTKGQFNESRFDRTNWYAFTEFGQFLMTESEGRTQ